MKTGERKGEKGIAPFVRESMHGKGEERRGELRSHETVNYPHKIPKIGGISFSVPPLDFFFTVVRSR